MSDKRDFFKKIDDFLLGHLSEEEATAFQQATEEDEALAKALDGRKQLLKGMAVGGRRKLKSKLKSFHQEVIETPVAVAKTKTLNWRPIAAAAAALLLGVLLYWLWTPTAMNATQIYASNYEPFELVLNLRDTNDKENLDLLVQQYRNQEYTKVIPALETLLQEKNNSQLQLALAISRFEAGDQSNAFLPLQNIITANDPFLADQARWYSALFYLQLDQVDRAIPFLQTLATTPDADKHAEAKKILSQLK